MNSTMQTIEERLNELCGQRCTVFSRYRSLIGRLSFDQTAGCWTIEAIDGHSFHFAATDVKSISRSHIDLQ